ncbi:MAG: hypothetical protein J7K40_12915 [candidate division Zixibacteria bacterium]|nr:hypothetical protein [candidate division Zixibacteria bacterium]
MPMFRTGRKSDQPLPTMTELFQAYPNPFNSSTSIKIYLTKSQRTKLEIFDVRQAGKNSRR